jgi:hypothetical protein
MSTIPIRLAPPPRNVPVSLAIANLFGGAAQLGWFLFGFGMIFFWSFVAHADYSFFTEWGEHVQTNGTVRGIEPTAASVNRRRVMAHYYEYSVAGRPFKGTSYASEGTLERGAVVAVEYLKSNPQRSRIAGMRSEMFGPGVALITIFPLIGLAIVVFSMRWGAGRNALLRNGNVATTQQTKAAVDSRLSSIAGMLNAPGSRIQDSEKIGLHDPQRPQLAYVLSPSEIDENGELRGALVQAIRALVIPVLILGFNTLPILTRLGFDWLGAIMNLLQRR